jgi:MSHA pilin protein MshD
MCVKGRRPQCGASLPELVFFIVVVGLALAGVLTVLNITVQKSADPLPAKQALAVAESLVEEISLKNYASGGFAGGATQANRSSFDDVGDYGGFSTTGIYTVDGIAPLAGLSNYSVSPVTVASTTLNGVAAKLITVTVVAPDGNSYSVSGYRTQY